MIANIRQLRASTKEILSAVSRGDTVWVTSRGKTCAKIMPVNYPDKVETKDEAFGMWKTDKRTQNVHAYVRGIRKWHCAV